MALDPTTASQYFQGAQQQQQLFAYWFAAGDVARAELAMDVANWYYQQLGMAIYLPANDPGYVPSPTSPQAAATIAQNLPLVLSGDLNGQVAAGLAGAGSAIGAGIQDLTSGLPSPGTGSGRGPTSVQNPLAGSGALNSGPQPQSLDDYCFEYPDDPICYYDGGPPSQSGGEGPVTITVNDPTTIVINQTGLTIGTVASAIQGALAAAAAAIANATDAAVAAALAGVQNAINALGTALQNVFGVLSRLAGLILKFLQGLLLDIVHALVAAVQAIGQMLKDVFQNVIMPALQALQQLRNYLIQIYQRFLRPLLIWLQDARKVLAILKAFHIGFATKLDNAIADIQAKITAPLFYLLTYTNMVANYLNLILTAGLILQRPLFLNSFNAYKGSALTLGINAMNPTVDPAALAALQASVTVQPPPQSVAATTQLLTDGTGAYADTVTAQSAQLDVYLLQGFE